jgi:anti-anti-sigma factor
MEYCVGVCASPFGGQLDFCRTGRISGAQTILVKEHPMAANPIAISDLNMEVVTNAEETTVHCSGRIISSTVSNLQATVRGLIPKSNIIVLDLTDVSYLDSSGLGAIVGLYLSAKRQHCSLKLIHLNERLQELFRITKLASVFEGHQDFLGYTPD